MSGNGEGTGKPGELTEKVTCELSMHEPASKGMIGILESAKVIAIVGLSPNEGKASIGVARYLIEQGFTVVPVNPMYQEVLGLRSFPTLKDIQGPVDVVDIFRRPEAVPSIVEDAISIGAKTVWMQERIVNNAAAERALEAGLKVVMDRCILKEHKKMALPRDIN